MMITGTARFADNSGCKMRAAASMAPPGGNGTTACICRVGKAGCATSAFDPRLVPNTKKQPNEMGATVVRQRDLFTLPLREDSSFQVETTSVAPPNSRAGMTTGSFSPRCASADPIHASGPTYIHQLSEQRLE